MMFQRSQFIAPVLLWGCTTVQYVKSGATAAEANRDKAQSSSQAANVIAPHPGGYMTPKMASLRQTMTESHAMDDCMAARGYYRK